MFYYFVIQSVYTVMMVYVFLIIVMHVYIIVCSSTCIYNKNDHKRIAVD